MVHMGGAALILGALLIISSLSGRPSAFAEAYNAVHIDVPLYSDSIPVWSSAIRGSAATDTIFLDPSDGPGNSPRLDYMTLVKDAQARGIRVLGYVDTVWAKGAVSISQAEAAIDKYYSWYGVDGIMFDETTDSCSPAPVGYYTELYDFVKQKPGPDVVVLNPGTFVGECYSKISDVLITFEDTYANYLTYQQPDWVRNYPASHFLHIILDTPTAADMQNAVRLAISRNVNGVYVTDKGANGTNPYSSLPSYFDAEVSYLSSPFSLGIQTLKIVAGPGVNIPRATVAIAYMNNARYSLTGTVYLVVYNAIGQAVYYSTATVNPMGGEVVMAYLMTNGLSPGAYAASVFVISRNGVAISDSSSFSFSY
jgi:hypothetical protein